MKQSIKAVKQVQKSSLSQPHSQKWLVFLILGVLGFSGGAAAVLVVLFLTPEEILPDLSFPAVPSASPTAEAYSNLTGMPLVDSAVNTAPTYCVQTPNGLDGARPQAGLNEAGVVFEAIAEAGITRFAAIYQAPRSAVIGPIRSLRLYYLEWDTPFDCTIVHAGGADDAIEAVAAGGYRDLSENYAYMYRGNYYNYERLWNNLFTTSYNLATFAADYGYDSSTVNGFTRLTPKEAEHARADSSAVAPLVITESTTADTSLLAPAVTDFAVTFSNFPAYNVFYQYNTETNSYNRFYATGDPHEVYTCPQENLGEITPESACTLTQLSPAVVVAMVVDEHIASDNYHENIATVGSGAAYIFQNGGVVEGYWEKSSVADQIRFYDTAGAAVPLVPGQTFIEAVPGYGSVDY